MSFKVNINSLKKIKHIWKTISFFQVSFGFCTSKYRSMIETDRLLDINAIQISGTPPRRQRTRDRLNALIVAALQWWIIRELYTSIHRFRLQLRIKINLDPPLWIKHRIPYSLKKKTTIVHSTSNTSVTKFYPTVQISYTKTMPRWVYRPALQRTYQVSTPGHPLQRSSKPECFRMFEKIFPIPYYNSEAEHV